MKSFCSRAVWIHLRGRSRNWSHMAKRLRLSAIVPLSRSPRPRNYLIGQLRHRFGADRVLHVPVRANLKDDLGKEPTHRTRSFLFAAIGAVTAHLLGPSAHFLFRKWRGESEFAAGRPGRRRQGDANHAPPGVSGISARSFPQFSVNPSMSVNPYAWMTKVGGHRAISAERLRRSHQRYAKLHACSCHDQATSSLWTMLAVYRSALCDPRRRSRSSRP